jgi:hypothetical protein
MGTKAENESARIGARKPAVEAMKKLIECERACGASNDDIAQDFSSVIYAASDHLIITNIRLEPDKDVRIGGSGPAIVRRVPDWCR